MIEIRTIEFAEPLVTWQDVTPLLSALGIVFISAAAYLYYKLKRTSRTYPFVFFDVVVLPKTE